MKISVAQIAPVWLDRAQTLAKIEDFCLQAAGEGSRLVCFGEALLPGYPFWIELTNGAVFGSPVQMELHARYLEQAVVVERGDLDSLCQISREKELAMVVGTIERPPGRGGHSVYCSLVYIDEGRVKNVHRKLMPTYEERLSWAQGDGHGLKVFPLGPFTLGALNCWENWMPLPRTALQGQGENLPRSDLAGQQTKYA